MEREYAGVDRGFAHQCSAAEGHRVKGLGVRQSLLMLGLVPSLLIAIVLVAYLTHTRIQDLELALQERGLTLARHLAAASEYGVDSGDRSYLARQAQLALEEPDVYRVTILDDRGGILVDRVDQITITPPPSAQLFAFKERIYGGAGTAKNTEGARLEAAKMPWSSTDLRPVGEVQVMLSGIATNARQREVIATSLALSVMCLNLGLLFGALLGHRISEPVLRMEKAVAELGRGNMKARVREASGGELGSLERGINAMARELRATRDRLQQQVYQATSDARETMEELEIKNAELDIARKRALQASRVKSEFLANVSHEIRTPMNGILGFIELLEGTPLQRTQLNYLHTVRSSARTLLTLVNDILDLSKIEAGKVQLRQEPFLVRSVLEDCVILYAPLAHAKRLQLNLDLHPDLPACLIGDAQRITQVVANLVSNAVKFTEQGRIRVSAEIESATGDRIGLGLVVQDTGIGISEADRDRLFDVFSQIDSSAARKHAGTGLGLAISKRLTELMNGSIGLSSVPGQGTTFRVQIPLHYDAKSDAGAPRSAALQGQRVVLVSADADLTEATNHQLAPSGVEFVAVSDGGGLANAVAGQLGRCEPKVLLDLSCWQSFELREIVGVASDLGTRAPLHLVTLGRDLTGASEDAPLASLAQLEKPCRTNDLLSALAPLVGAELARSAAGSSMQSVDASAQPAPAAGHSPPLRPRVLVADDNPVNRRLACLFLEQLGIEADEVVDGKAAIEAYSRGRYDLILMDVHMPEMDGLEATRQIRQLGPATASRRVPIVALTADAMRDDRGLYQSCGMDDYLAKPFGMEDLAGVVRRWLARGPSS